MDSLETVAKQLLAQREDIDRKLREIGEKRPPLTAREVCPDGCNINDRTVNAAMRRWRDGFTQVYVPDLNTDDPELWELLSAAGRYSVVEYWEPDEDPEASAPWYGVVDNETGERVEDEILTEAMADNVCSALNREDAAENLHGFPFAHNYGWEIEDWQVDRFSSAGFLVYRYDDRIIAGIDGGGYSFDGAHWFPAFWAEMKGYMVDTDTGPRMVEG